MFFFLGGAIKLSWGSVCVVRSVCELPEVNMCGLNSGRLYQRSSQVLNSIRRSQERRLLSGRRCCAARPPLPGVSTCPPTQSSSRGRSCTTRRREASRTWVRGSGILVLCQELPFRSFLLTTSFSGVLVPFQEGPVRHGSPGAPFLTREQLLVYRAANSHLCPKPPPLPGPPSCPHVPPPLRLHNWS